MIRRQVVLKITASGKEPVSQQSVSSTISVSLLKEAIEALANYESSYFILSKDGLTTDFKVTYPECEDQTMVDIDDSIMMCSLYDSRWYSEGNADNCNVDEN